MSFSSFSKDHKENSFTSVENRFIEKYLPEADGDAVRAYLYGLYLCGLERDFDAKSTAQLLRIPYDRFLEIFTFWEECGLVQILSREPLFVEYLPVSAAVGKPKPIRPEKYLEFNRELFKLLQRAGKDLKPYEQQRVLEFLENTPMERQAFLLVVEYYVKKNGEKLSMAHVLNAAAKLARENKYTYEQVEAEYADFNRHEEALKHIFALLSIYRKPQDADYAMLETWLHAGMQTEAVYACAEALKKGSLGSLDQLVSELIAGGYLEESSAREYLALRNQRAEAVFQVARKLGVKVQNPRPYIEEYAEKWLERGYDAESLTLVAGLGLRLSYGFAELDTLLDKLYAAGIVDPESVRTYCAGQDKQLKLLQKIQAVVGVIKKTQTALDMLAAWKSWSFSEEMILEAAKRSAGAAAPLSYMNKLLSEWKRLGAFTVSEIPERTQQTAVRQTFKSEAAIAADERSDREHFYAARRETALRRVERARAMAEKDAAYREATEKLRGSQLDLAKAEMFDPSSLPAIQEGVRAAEQQRAEALKRLRLTERDFLPQYICAKCSDTGFLPDGRACDCYKKGQP